jgi:DNA processing protein
MKKAMQPLQPNLYSSDEPANEDVARPAFDEEAENNSVVTLFALASMPGVGFATIRNLYEKLEGRLGDVWSCAPDELTELMRKARIPQSSLIGATILQQRERLTAIGQSRAMFYRRRGVSLLFRGSNNYPKRLNDLPDPPPWLFIEGDPAILHDERIVAVVGTRTPSNAGLSAVKSLSISLIQERCIILSGLAEGIDEVGHRSAVDLGVPTIAVLGHGIDISFPVRTAALRSEIVNRGGAVITEYLPNDSYAKERFVHRNRIQAAMSGAIAVVEGRSKSGTAHTVRFAKSLKRPIFGVMVDDDIHQPTKELLVDLQKSGNPVFDISLSIGREAMRLFIRKQFGNLLRNRKTSEFQIFAGVLEEAKRISREYEAQSADIEWLVSQIEMLTRD